MGQLTLFDELRGHIDAGLEWISKYGDLNGDGYVEYASTSGKGLINQGWKDSGDAIIDTDGRLATPPIALVEVQGCVYLAKLTLADLYERAGEPDRAGRLQQEAQDLRGRFNRDFRLEEKGLYADLSFERTADGVVVKVLRVEGPLDVIIESGAVMPPGSEVGKP